MMSLNIKIMNENRQLEYESDSIDIELYGNTVKQQYRTVTISNNNNNDNTSNKLRNNFAGVATEPTK